MAFLIRRVTSSSDGREIVRIARIEGDRLTIGRAPGCAIHLTDLAVALDHILVEQAEDRLAVTAKDGLWFELDGRKTAVGAIGLGTGGDIRVAGHLLRFMPKAADADDIEIHVEQVAQRGAKLDRSAERLFSLSSVLPGKRILSWLFTTIVLTVCLGFPIKAYYDRQERAERFARFQADEIWSSGHLSQAHAGLRRNCTACHVKPFEAVRDTACKTCHTKVHDHADPFRLARAQPDLSRWQRVELAVKETFDIPPARCVDCHTEHEGPQEMAPTPQRFCSSCHAGLQSKLPDTRIGDAGDFGRSHPEFRPTLITGWTGERPTIERVSMAKRPREASGLKFPHALHLSRVGGVAQMARRLGSRQGFGKALECSNCHRPDPQGTRFRPMEMESDCASCHSLAFGRVGNTVRTLRHGDPAQVVADLRDFYQLRGPARPPTLAPMARRRPGDTLRAQEQAQFARATHAPRIGEAVAAVFSRGGACYDCHQIDRPGPASLAFRVRPVAFPTRYIGHGWFDHRPHEAESCSTCHAAAGSSSAADLLLPGIATCRTCHGGESSAKPVASSCAMCHNYHKAEGAPSSIVRRGVRGGRARAASARGEAPG